MHRQNCFCHEDSFQLRWVLLDSLVPWHHELLLLLTHHLWLLLLLGNDSSPGDSHLHHHLLLSQLLLLLLLLSHQLLLMLQLLFLLQLLHQNHLLLFCQLLPSCTHHLLLLEVSIRIGRHHLGLSTFLDLDIRRRLALLLLRWINNRLVLLLQIYLLLSWNYTRGRLLNVVGRRHLLLLLLIIVLATCRHPESIITSVSHMDLRFALLNWSILLISI